MEGPTGEKPAEQPQAPAGMKLQCEKMIPAQRGTRMVLRNGEQKVSIFISGTVDETKRDTIVQLMGQQQDFEIRYSLFNEIRKKMKEVREGIEKLEGRSNEFMGGLIDAQVNEQGAVMSTLLVRQWIDELNGALRVIDALKKHGVESIADNDDAQYIQLIGDLEETYTTKRAELARERLQSIT